MIPRKIVEDMLDSFKDDCKYSPTQIYGYVRPRKNGEFTMTSYAVNVTRRFGIRMTEVARCWSDRDTYVCKNIWKNIWGKTQVEFDERRNRPDESYGWYDGKWGKPIRWKSVDRWFSKYVRYRNLGALADTKYRYCAFDKYRGDLTLAEYCRLLSKYPQVEILAKNGMSHLVKENFLARLSSDKGLRSFFRCHAKEISWRHEATPTAIIRAFKGGMSIDRAIELEWAKNYYAKAPKGVNRMELHKYLTANRIDRYDWYHYADSVKEAGLDIIAFGTTFPRDFRKAERNVRRRIRRKSEKDRKEGESRMKCIAERINALLAKMKMRLDARVGNLSVVFPTTQEEFTKEGNAMRNCIGGYFDICASGRSLCFFIRKDGKSCADVEMSTEGEIRQCRGRFNNDTDEAVKKYAEEVAKRISCELRKRRAA